MVLEAGGPVFSQVKIICDSNTTKGNLPSITPFASANPMEVLFPGKATYSDEKTFTFGGIDSAFSSAQVDLSLCMFNVTWVYKEFEKLGKETPKGQKSPDASISAFLRVLFNSVLVNSGDVFKLTIASDPKDPTGNRLLIVDSNFIDTKGITPYEITAVTQNSICRNVSLQSKVPNEMASAAMVSAPSSLTTQNAVAFGFINNASTKSTPTAASNDAEPKLADAIKAIGVGGVTDENVNGARTAIRAALAPKAPTDPSSYPIPIDFSCTLDGIEGFVFGNAITCNYLPSLFKQSQLCFTVTKVEHNISANDWTTTLSTVCRVIP